MRRRLEILIVVGFLVALPLIAATIVRSQRPSHTTAASLSRASQIAVLRSQQLHWGLPTGADCTWTNDHRVARCTFDGSSCTFSHEGGVSESLCVYRNGSNPLPLLGYGAPSPTKR
jgi:hypothetical protein